MEKLKVLYAEDDPLTVMEVAEQLEERGFEVIVATNGTEALKLFRERQPNVVLLDVDMPGHNGFEVLQIIRLTDHYTPIVIYSSLGDEANQMRGLESGAYTYGRKIIFRSAFRRIMDRRKKRKIGGIGI